MITIKEKLKLLTQCFGQAKLSNTGKNVDVVCPVCVVSGKVTNKKKLSIDLEKGIYHCWVCNSKGRNIGHLSRKYRLDAAATVELLKLYGSGNLETPPELSPIKPILPEDFTLLYNMSGSKSYKRHYQYLVARGFDPIKMKKFRVGASATFEYANRVIFPSFDENCELNYFVSRTIVPDSSYRYKNFEGSRKDVIFRQIDIDFKEPMVLVEGVFDLVHCPSNSTCILGSWLDINYRLFKEIVKNKTPVTLCFDPDAQEKSLKIARALREYCVDVKLSQHTEKDFGDMTRDEVNYYIQTAQKYEISDRIGYLIQNINSGSIF